jgi:hypothetical protein
VTTNDRRRAVAYRETIATTRDVVEEVNLETDDRGKRRLVHKRDYHRISCLRCSLEFM